jgi:UTP--glucose-1-phosphate uridylyltransferase
MTKLFAETQSSVIALDHVPPSDTKKYGIVAISDEGGAFHRIASIVEKPEPEKAPSNLGVVGRYILQPSIFSALEEVQSDKNGEIQLTDAIAILLKNEAVYGYYLTGKRYDCGNKLGYLQATIDYALRHPEVGDAFREYLMSYSKQIKESLR